MIPDIGKLITTSISQIQNVISLAKCELQSTKSGEDKAKILLMIEILGIVGGGGEKVLMALTPFVAFRFLKMEKMLKSSALQQHTVSSAVVQLTITVNIIIEIYTALENRLNTMPSNQICLSDQLKNALAETTADLIKLKKVLATIVSFLKKLIDAVSLIHCPENSK